MDNTAIIDAIDEVKTALASAGLGQVYDHIPAKPTLPSVIIAPAANFIEDGTAFNQRELNLDVWIISTPSTDNRNLQQTLYTNIAKAITALEAVDSLQFDTVEQPTPVEFNQTKTLAATIAVNVTL